LANPTHIVIIDDSFNSPFSLGKSEFPAEIPHFLAFVGIIFIKGPDDEIWDFSNQENGL